MFGLIKNALFSPPRPALPFKMTVELAYTVNADTELVFNFQPARTARQRVLAEKLLITGPCTWEASTDPLMANRIIRMRAGSGELVIDYQVDLELMPNLVARPDIKYRAEGVATAQAMPYLLASRYCESDKLLSFAYAKFSSISHPYARARAICDWVQGNLQFTSGVTDWHTSAVDTFAERRGVCRDYSHLMIALCRATNLPARFVTGLDYGCDFGETDFHAYVEVLIGGHWFLFDPTGLCPRSGLIRIATGRDAADTAFATIFGPTTMRSMKLSIAPVGITEKDVRALDRARYGISTAAMEDLVAPRPEANQAVAPSSHLIQPLNQAVAA